MVVEEGEMNSQGEAESRFQQDANKNHHSQFPPSSIGRETSIYSLTLDEFQHSLCETGKNFGSMNMDEFISSVWNAEENQAIITSSNLPLSQPFTDKDPTTLRKQPSLPRQPSLSLPAPLCRKTVDEVWSQIQKEQHDSTNNNEVLDNTESAPRQPTFGEMTLEDFLVKAGVVREQPCAPPQLSHHSHHLQHQQQPQPQPQQQHYTSNNGAMPGMGSPFVGRNVIGAVSNVVAPGYQVGEASGGYAVNGKRDGGAVFHQQGVSFGGSGYGMGPTMGMGGPVSPANSSDGIGNDCGQFGLEMGGLRGRKRIGDGPVEKVVERRQRRMIKNRESAARSRARKQAYTVELEAELNQLKEENAQLRQALAELERRRKQQIFEELSNISVQTNAQKVKEKDKLRALRRYMSYP
ncbi:protein ABSCISIC ACID-INSENSITIVE 5 isoform X2 [Vigna angularis]|uniref:protein ABSCISIC ACID-INSENSITIVE 5 isoform X2 n=1 Tax=Phaseolus angularis TaxID=3914 RepID=UPI00080A26CB|nr:protein ABSCISIC ACID-INSENSITIVE 5 isoform X2 [Vigna angularis]XP_052729201.1 protein ABSCISIC ACID-INSENSITIVE 5 isoform X2 [Vigna angularis]